MGIQASINASLNARFDLAKWSARPAAGLWQAANARSDSATPQHRSLYHVLEISLSHGDYTQIMRIRLIEKIPAHL
jgi:hypothetical protein